MSFLFFFSCLPVSITSTHDEVFVVSTKKETYESLEVLFDDKGRAKDALLLSKSSKTSWKREYMGSLQDPSAKKQLEITSHCEVPVPVEVERVCVPSKATVSVFAPYERESNHARALFRIRGFEKVWIHDLDILILPHPHWILLQERCTGEADDCEAIYAKRIQSILEHNLEHSLENDTDTILSHLFFSGKTKPPLCNTPSHDSQHHLSWHSFAETCPYPYTSLIIFWQKHITIPFILRRMGYGFELFDNNDVHVERIRIRGVTNDGIIHAENNGRVVIAHNQLEGISQQDIEEHHRNLTLPFRTPSPNNKIMGTGIAIVEGENEAELFSCREESSMNHRKSCVGRSSTRALCENHIDCHADARCVLGVCKSSSCDTKQVVIKHNLISGCSEFDWQKSKINDDGIRISSVSAQIEHNSILDFAGCDTLLDVGHRGGCDTKEGESPETIAITENVLKEGKIKTTGASAPLHQVVYTKNTLRNVRLSDYHQYWISSYIDNDWYIEEDADQRYIWGEHAAMGAQPWQEPYYGQMIFQHNRIWSQKENIALLQSKRFDRQKFVLDNNQFLGKSFVWLVSQGEKRVLDPLISAKQQYFIDQDWKQNKGEVQQFPIRIRDWKKFTELFPHENIWIQ